MGYVATVDEPSLPISMVAERLGTSSVLVHDFVNVGVFPIDDQRRVPFAFVDQLVRARVDDAALHAALFGGVTAPIDGARLRWEASLVLAGMKHIDPYSKERVYFIRSGVDGPIKIGTTKDVDARVKGLQTGSPVVLAVLSTIPGGYKLEDELHERFATLRMVGEWFRADPLLLALVELARDRGWR